MIRSGEIVAQRLGAILAHKYRAGMTNSVEIIKGVVHAKLKMLGSDLVCNVYGREKIFGHDYFSVVINRRPRNFGSGQCGNLKLKLLAHLFCKVAVVGNENGGGVFVVLGLGQHIGRHKFGVAAAVGHNENFAGACNHVNRHPAENLLFRLGNEGVSRADDFVDLFDRFGAVGKSGDGLRPADFIDFIHSRDFCGRENFRPDAAVL